MAARIFWVAFLSALAAQASISGTARAREGAPLTESSEDAEEENAVEESSESDSYADQQADIFGDYTFRR